MKKRKLRWSREPSLSTALDLAETAIVLGRPDEASDAAQLITEQSTSPSEFALAERILGSDSPALGKLQANWFEDNLRTGAQHRIHELRTRLGLDPRNAVAWSDLGFEYAALGQGEAAERAMRYALSLGAESRFILRSGARFLVHRGRADEAHSLLLRSPQTAKDPWLTAAEIAVAGSAGERPRFIRTGRGLISSDDFRPRHLSELESALATVELQSGADRRARQLFRRSLVEATENSLAQAEWASRRVSGLSLELSDFAPPSAFEARARHLVEVGAWENAVTEARFWHADQPFAGDGASFGSFAASVGLMDFKEAADIARLGLDSNPDHLMLRNNLAYALLELGDVENAALHIRRLPPHPADSVHAVVFTATRGLLAYRSGLPSEGKLIYEAAIALSRRHGHRTLEAVASLKLAEEELRAGTEDAETTLRRALHISRNVEDAAAVVWRERLATRSVE